MPTDKPEPKPDHGKLHRIRSAVDRLTTALDDLGETESAGLDARGFTWDQRATLTVASRHLRAAAIGLMGGEDPGPRVDDEDGQGDEDDPDPGPAALPSPSPAASAILAAAEPEHARDPGPAAVAALVRELPQAETWYDMCEIVRAIQHVREQQRSRAAEEVRIGPDLWRLILYQVLRRWRGSELSVASFVSDLHEGEAGLMEALAQFRLHVFVNWSDEDGETDEPGKGACSHPGQRGGPCQMDGGSGACRWCGRSMVGAST